MAYIKTNKAHSHHQILTSDGAHSSRYSRYETGQISGRYRDLPAIIADETGFDGLGFDASAGTPDDSWYVVNAFNHGGRYVDSIAVGGAMDADHALRVAETQLDSLGADYGSVVTQNIAQLDSTNDDHANSFSIDAISKLMTNPSQDKHYLPVITASELHTEAERKTFDCVQWDSGDGLVSHGGKDSRLYVDMTRADTLNELVNELDLADELARLGAEEAEFDALMDSKNRLPLLKDRLFNAMSRASLDDLSVTNVTQTKPFKRQGVSNIAFVFDLSDGQKLSIWFHNPDSTPSKLMASDIMISWKWMLNKRDMTAVLSPKNGDNVQLPVLAKRIMRVAAKNSKRFKAAQARKAKIEQELDDVKMEISRKNDKIERLDSDIDSLNKAIDAAMKAKQEQTQAADESASNTPSFLATDNYWENSVASIQALSDSEFERLSDELEDGNHRSENVVFRAKFAGVADLIAQAEKILESHQTNGNLRIDMRQERDELYDKINEIIARFGSDDGTSDKPEQKSAVQELYELGKLAPKSREAIKADDPDAIEKLEAKLAYAQAYAALMRNTNKLVRKGDDEGLKKLGFKDKTIASLKEPDFAGRTGFADYQMKNNNAEMNRIKKRLKSLYADRDAQPAPASSDDNQPSDDYAQLSDIGQMIVAALKGDLSKYNKWDKTEENAQSLTEKQFNALIKALVANNYHGEASRMYELRNGDDEDESKHPQMFLARNKNRLNTLGIGDNDIQVGMDGDYSDSSEFDDLYHIDTGLFANKTLNFADSVCKVVDAATAIGADTSVGDFTATAYQDSMFDALDSKSRPTYGITVQISKDGVYVRADIDGLGHCKILKGDSGTEVIATIQHVFTDNTNEYQAAIADALNVQVDDDMDTTPEKDAPKFSVGDNVVWRNSNGEVAGNFRGYTDNDDKVVLVSNGSQMTAPTNEVFFDDTPVIADPPATDDTPSDAPATADNELASRVDAIVDQVESNDFDPVTFDSDELIELLELAENDADLSDQLNKASKTYQDKLVAISMKAMASLAGSE